MPVISVNPEQQVKEEQRPETPAEEQEGTSVGVGVGVGVDVGALVGTGVGVGVGVGADLQALFSQPYWQVVLSQPEPSALQIFKILPSHLLSA